MVFSIIALVISVVSLILVASFVNYMQDRFTKLKNLHNGLVEGTSQGFDILLDQMTTMSQPTCGEKAVAEAPKRKRGRPAKNK